MSIDLTSLLLLRIRLLSQRRIAWLRYVWAGMRRDEDASFTVHHEVDGYLSTQDIPALETEWYDSEPEMIGLSNEIAEVERQIAHLPSSRLAQLQNTFGLAEFEADLLQLCFALAVDPDLSRLFAYMQDHSSRPYITLKLAARLFGYGTHQYLASNSNILHWRILLEKAATASDPVRYECDPAIRNWLMGANSIEEPLSGIAHLQPLLPALPGWKLQDLVQKCRRLLQENSSLRLRISVCGPRGTGRRSFSAAVARELGCSLLRIDADLIQEDQWQEIWLKVQRHCFLSQQCPAWYGNDINGKLNGISASTFPVQFIICEDSDYLSADPAYIDFRFQMPTLGYEERLAAWNSLVPASVTWPQQEFHELILRYQSSIGQIAAIGRRNTKELSSAYALLRAETGLQLGKLARPANASFHWEDLILPVHIKNALEDLRFEASERTLFWEQPEKKRLFPTGQGLIALFNGAPGTGKTMAAQVLAAELQLEIYRVDLSTVVSKYVGESSKNIERILSSARHMDIVLLFDEADSLFGKRTEVKDAHDRYANMETNFLLQAIEEYPGIVILSSNKKSGIDPAFMRRFRYVLEFPKPDRAQRLVLWRQLLIEMTGENLAMDTESRLSKLADQLELTGAQIKLSILSAVFIARRDRTPVRLEHLLTGVERELMKEGKSLGRQPQIIAG